MKIRYIEALCDMLREKTGNSIIAEVSIAAYATGSTEYKTKLFIVKQPKAGEERDVELIEYETLHELVSAIQQMIDENGESLTEEGEKR